MPWEYSQRTGEITHNGQVVGSGYSGTGGGRNNPTMEGEENVGPIPQGRYTIGPAHPSERTGPHTMDLTPDGHDARGRTLFRIHGDNRTHDASTGCIVLDRTIRNQISESGDDVLNVVP
jgi:hypothetical protein